MGNAFLGSASDAVRRRRWMTPRGVAAGCVVAAVCLMAAGSVCGQWEWVSSGSGNWNTPSNWSTGTVPNSATAQVTFGNAITAPATVTVSLGATVGRITFDNSTYSYTLTDLQSQHLILDGDATFDVQSGTHTVSGQISVPPGTVHKVGPGKLVLDSYFSGGPIFYGPYSQFDLEEGTLDIKDNVYALFQGDLRMSGATLELSSGGTYNDLPTNIEVVDGTNNLIRDTSNNSPYGFTLGGKLTGGGTLTYEASSLGATRLQFGSNSVDFTGTLSINHDMEVEFSQNVGIRNGILDLAHPAARAGNYGGGANVVRLGGLKGVAGSQLYGLPAGFTGNSLIEIGGANQDAAFFGDIVETSPTDTVAIVKRGANTQTFNGNNTYSGTTYIDGGTLIVNGTHTGGGLYTVWVGAKLGGSGTINSSVNSLGTVAPGNSPGILTINGNYTQTPYFSTLEIEVGGLSLDPVVEHDQLRISGTATLAGRLEVPIINGFVPHVGDEITFLTAGMGRTGAFESVSAPGLASANPNAAIEVVYNSNDVRLRFVNPSLDIQFNGQVNSVDWNDGGTWTNALPDTTNVITVQNLVSGAQRVEVQSDNARVHELTVTSSTDPVTVAIHNGVSLSATNSVSVGQKGIVELGTSIDPGGILVSAEVAVESGGLLSGNGTVKGDLNVGIDAGPQMAVLSPGFSIGHIEVQGNLQQGATGTLHIEIQSSTQLDTVAVTGSAQLGGKLQIDASLLTTTPAPGTLFPIVTADSITGEFDTVESTGNNSIYFVATTIGVTVYAESMERGDMNGRDGITPEDFELFAFGLMNRSTSKYFAKCNCEILPQQAGDFSGNGRLDFDDIAGFQSRMSDMGMSSADLMAAIDRYLSPVPEPGSGLVMLAGSGLLTFGRSRRQIGRIARKTLPFCGLSG